MDDIRAHNRNAWNKYVEGSNPWTIPSSPKVIAAARAGVWEIYLTESKPVPREWFPELAGAEVLCLASGGGQQASILAAVGARVTLLDNSPRQLAQDKFVAEREGLDIRLVEGDMRDLSVFPNDCFDLIFHPVSNIFIPDVLPVWNEAFRVLKPGCCLLAGLVNPVEFTFDYQLSEAGTFQVKHSLPYSDLDSITDAEREAWFGLDSAVEFSHTYDDLIQGQIDAGFMLVGFYESRRQEGEIRKYLPTYFATRALKPPSSWTFR